MGPAMARRLLEADHDLVVYNRTPEKLAEIASLGAGVSKSIGEAARHGGVVVTMLADDTALAHVGRGPGGLVETLPQGCVHLAMGPKQIAAIEELARAHVAAGQTPLAEQQPGRPVLAAAGPPGTIKHATHRVGDECVGLDE